MAIGDDLKNFKTNLNETRGNVRDLRGKVDTTGDVVEKARQGLEYVERVEEQAGDFLKTIKSMKFSLKVVEKVGPMKVVAKLVKRVLDSLEDVTIKVRDKARELDRKIKDGDYINKLKDAENRLEGFENDLRVTEKKLLEYEGSTASTIAAFDLIGAPVDPLENAADSTVRPLNTVLTNANALYDSIETEIDGVAGFVRGFPARLFQPAIDVAKAFGNINSSLSFLSGPLNAVYAAVKPVEGLLDAIGFVYKITVGPVIDFILDKLGINKIMDRVADKIKKLLPDADILNELASKIDAAFGEIDEFLGVDGWEGDIVDFISDITDDVFDMIDKDATGTIKIGDDNSGSENAETLNGGSGDDVLDGRKGDDVVNAMGGDDVILASAGDDTVYGGDGFDRLIMGDTLLNYVFDFTNPGGTDPVVFQHIGGTFGAEVTHGIEQYVFTDGSYSWEQMRNNVKSVNSESRTGTVENEVFYAVSTSGAVTINGAGGDDLLSGSQFADSLTGGSGNDRIISNKGADTVDGGSGNDTWVYGENDESGNSLTKVDLITGETWDGDSRDTLISIENITMQDSRDTDLFGDNRANVIIGGGAKDWIDGRGGNDSLVGGAGKDLLIGGAGVDTLRGGEHADWLVAGGTVIAGRGETYDGGAGFDRLIYSNDYRYYDVEPRQFTDIAAQEHSGPVRIYAGTGRIERMSTNGRTLLATDQATDIERFIGSDENDILYGARGEFGNRVEIDGGGGNDVLYSHGANLTSGGKGDDTIHVIDGGSFDGNEGVDTLDTRGMDARWFIRLVGAIGTEIRAFKPDESQSIGGSSGANTSASTTLFSGNLNNIERVILGRHNDEVRLMGSEKMTIYGADGDDTLIRDGATDGTGLGYLYGGNGDDHLVLKTSGALHGGNGDDELFVNASGGEHMMTGGAGEDYFEINRTGSSFNQATADGGTGYDRISIDQTPWSSETGHRSELNLMTGVFQTFSTGRFGESISDVNLLASNFEEVIGGEIRDDITGTNASERLIGRGGNDTLRGNGDDDELFGGNHNDSLLGGGGDDLLHGGGGSDTLRGEAGIDTASYANTAPGTIDGSVVAGDFGNVSVTLGEAGATGIGYTASGTDRLYDIENLIGGKGNDRLTGNSGDNALTGGDGNDTLLGGGGDDVLVLGTGDDSASGGDGDDTIILDLGNATIDGGAGIDTLDLGNLPGQVEITLSGNSGELQLSYDVPVWRDTGTAEARLFGSTSLTPQLVLETEAIFANDLGDLSRALPAPGTAEAALLEIAFSAATATYNVVVTGIERITGGVSDDRLAGSALANVLRGEDGDDLLNGNAGNDKLFGDDGEDALTGGMGNDTLNGGDGMDSADYRFSNTGVRINLRDGVTPRDGHGGQDVLVHIENAVGGFGDDVIVGSTGANILNGGFFGNDTINGSGGTDTVTYELIVDGPMTVNLGLGRSAGIKGNDTLISIENVIGSEYFGDNILGNAGGNRLDGHAGDDTVNGASGNDTLIGGTGQDVMIGGVGSDLFFVDDLGDSVIESRKWGGVDEVRSEVDFWLRVGHIENLSLLGDADHRAIGNGLANVIRGNAGDNILDGGKNVDTLFGGLGDDVYHLRSPGDSAVERADGGVDTVKAFRSLTLDANVEKLFLQTTVALNGLGNNLDNVIVGNNAANTIAGREGSDVLKGKAGNDTFVFDRAIGAGNVDRIIDFEVIAGDNDTLKFKGAMLGGGVSAGVLAAGHFKAGTSATDANDRFVFDQASGRLWFDVDGQGVAAQVLVATFEQNARVEANDILIF